MRGKRLVFEIIDSNTANNVQKSPFSLTGQRGEITAGVLLIFFFFLLNWKFDVLRHAFTMACLVAVAGWVFFLSPKKEMNHFHVCWKRLVNITNVWEHSYLHGHKSDGKIFDELNMIFFSLGVNYHMLCLGSFPLSLLQPKISLLWKTFRLLLRHCVWEHVVLNSIVYIHI